MASFAQNSSGLVMLYWYMAWYSLNFEPSGSWLEGTMVTEFACHSGKCEPAHIFGREAHRIAWSLGV